eukprot:285436-Pyramimonas_sp.AAC.1
MGGRRCVGGRKRPSKINASEAPLGTKRSSNVQSAGSLGLSGARPSTQQRTGNGLANPGGERGAAQDEESS